MKLPDKSEQMQRTGQAYVDEALAARLSHDRGADALSEEARRYLNVRAGVPVIEEIRAALSVPAPTLPALDGVTLDEAWATAESVLPEGTWLYLARIARNGHYGAQVRGALRTGAAGNTPAAALLALAEKLRSRAEALRDAV